MESTHWNSLESKTKTIFYGHRVSLGHAATQIVKTFDESAVVYPWTTWVTTPLPCQWNTMTPALSFDHVAFVTVDEVSDTKSVDVRQSVTASASVADDKVSAW